MTEINNQKFYQFLADYNKINGDWKEAADENGDGVIYKSEFNEFMNANWNGNENGELTNDIINKFWKSIDTNRGKGTFSADGIKVGEPMVITVKSIDYLQYDDFSKIQGWGGFQSEHLESLKHNNQGQLTDSNFIDLYNSDAIVRLHLAMDNNELWNNPEYVFNTLLSRLAQLGAAVVSALATTPGMDKDLLKEASKTVIANYAKTCDGSMNWDDSGKSGWDLSENLIGHMGANRNSTGHRVWGCVDDDSSDSFVWGVRFRDFVDDIIDEYNRLISG